MPENTGLRILLACGRPLVTKDGKPMNVIRPGAEIEAVKRGLDGIRREIHVAVHDAAMLQEINKVLMNTEPEFDVLHFVGHGSETGVLCFEDDCGCVKSVVSDELERLVRDRVKLLVTMACHSESVVGPLLKDSDKPVSAAVCIKGEHPIEARAAEIFSGALYSGLSQGRTLRRSFDDALEMVRMDDDVGERAAPGTDKMPTPYKRFVLKGSGRLKFPNVPAGSVRIEDIIKPSRHERITRTDELFVGRNMEIAAAAQLLEPPRSGLSKRKPRIITLCGEGGIGKTRLAQAAAEWLAERGKFPGGIFEIACDGAADAQGLALAVLNGMLTGVGESVTQPGKALVELLKGQKERTLLVLDNLDDLFAQDADSGESGQLLKNCLTASPGLNVLATCRWPLELGSDEHAFTVEPMITDEAKTLFIECIPDRDIQHELNVMTSAEQIKALGGLLELTDGMPLCVILAARRLLKHGKMLRELLEEAAADLLKVMEAPEMKHLKKRLRSLRASLDLSYNHLSDPARKLFARMSFFPGGLFRELGDLGELLGEDWKEHGQEVTRYALARYDRHGDRYTMLNPVREYASEKLDKEEGDEFRRRATASWAEFASWNDLMLDVKPVSQERVAKLLNLPDDPDERRKVQESMRESSFANLSVEEDNLTYAAEWAMGKSDEAGLGIVDSLDDYLDLRKRWYTKERLYHLALGLRRQLAEVDPEEYMPDVAATLNGMGILVKDMGRPDEALKFYSEALEIERKLSEEHPDAYMPDVAAMLNNMGGLMRRMKRYDDAKPYLQEALDKYRKLSESHPDAYLSDLANTLNNMGVLHNDMGHSDKALKRYKEALDIYRDLSESHSDAYMSFVAGILNNIGELLRGIGNFGDAKPNLEEALEIKRKLFKSYPDAHRPTLARTLSNMGDLHYAMGHPDEAMKFYSEALQIRRKLSEEHPDAYMPEVATTLNNMGNLQAQMGHPDEAMKLYSEALKIDRKLSEEHPDVYMPGVAMMLNNIGAMHAQSSDPKEALKSFQEALEIYRKLSEEQPDAYMTYVAMTLNNMGELLRSTGNFDDAKPSLEEALKISRKLSESQPEAYLPEVAGTLNNMGLLYDDMGHPDEAVKFYSEALQIRREFFERYPSAHAQELLRLLRNASVVYEKLGMEEKVKECREEMAKVTKAMERK